MNKCMTVEQMVNSLMDEAVNQDVDLTGLTYENFNSFLDDAFDDGGETRCDKFCDLAWPYAGLEGDKLGSERFERRQHQCIKEAIYEIGRQLEKDAEEENEIHYPEPDDYFGGRTPDDR